MPLLSEVCAATLSYVNNIQEWENRTTNFISFNHNITFDVTNEESCWGCEDLRHLVKAVTYGRVHTETQATLKLRVHGSPWRITKQCDQALIWLSLCLQPRGQKPCVSAITAYVHMYTCTLHHHRVEITLTDGLFGCSTLINTNKASSFSSVLSSFITPWTSFPCLLLSLGLFYASL